MIDSNKSVSTVSGQEISITRIVNAPLARVWQVFTQAKHIGHWWGPNGFTTTTFEMEVRPGGLWRYVMHGPAPEGSAPGTPGTDYNNWIRYTTVKPLERLEYEHGGDDENVAEFNADISFQDLGNQTQVTLHLVLKSAEQLKHLVEFGAVQGGEQTLGRLDAYVSSTPAEQQFAISRSFKAPLEKVWQAWSDPAHFAKWWGPKGCTLRLEKMDFVEGGMLLYAMVWPGMPDMWGRFVYGRIAPQQSIEFINSFSNPQGEITRAPFPGMDDWPLQVFNTVTFTEEKDGQTTVSLNGGPINALQAERTRFAGFFESLEQGFGGTFSQLEEFLASAD
ncbi:MAG: SRPBCC family protein [Pseudomonadota bacterium]